MPLFGFDATGLPVDEFEKLSQSRMDVGMDIGVKRGESQNERVGLERIDRRPLVKGCQRQSEAEPAMSRVRAPWRVGGREVVGGLGQPLLKALSERKEKKRDLILARHWERVEF